MADQTQPNISHVDNTLTEFQPLFVMPSINPTPECNLWGPLCQTGTVVVDVDMKSTTTQTTVSCSDFLSAKSRSLGLFLLGDPGSRSFLSSPECTSYANWAVARQQGNNSVLSYSNCATNLAKPPEDYLPPHYTMAHGHDEYCCGPCVILIDEIRVLYFADQSPVLCSNKSLQADTIISNVASTVISSLQINRNGADSLQTHEYNIATSGSYIL